MRTKSIVLLILALGCGLVASIGISQIIEQNKNPGSAPVETEAILVAMKPIAGQEQLKSDNIKLEQWPKKLIPKGALTRIEDVEGRRIKYSIAPGEPILQNKLVGEQDKRATVEVPPGYRLVAVHADAVSAVGNLVQPGDRVDVLVYLKNFHGPQQAGATTILQDIKVFAVNDQWRPADDKGTDAVAVKNVALLVTPEQAEKVTLATELGKVKLVLRSPDDNLKVEGSEGTTSKDLFGLNDNTNKKEELDFLSKGKQEPKGGGILGMFGVGQKNAPVDLAAATPVNFEHFTMELIEGPAARNVEFTKAPGANAKWQSSLNGSTGQAPAGPQALPGGLPQGADSQSTGLGPAGLPGELQPGDAVSLGPPAERD